MKKRNIANLILTSSILFFSACSNKTPETPKVAKKSSSQSLSAYSIIGIDQSKPTHSPLFVINSEPQEDNFHIRIEEPQIEEPQNMEIAYTESLPLAKTIPIPPTPIYENITSYSHVEETPTIEVISYASAPLKNYVKKTPSTYAQNIEVVSYGSTRGMTQSAKNYDSPNSSVIKDEIEAKAKSFLGTRYVWGATGPSKFDCSGFTQWVYRDSGITIPRVSRDQAKVGNYVEYADLRRGDMVFFDTKKHPQGKVTHVGIYLGNNNFIHASSGAKKVVIYNFDEKPYYKKRFLWGRRVINNNYLALK